MNAKRLLNITVLLGLFAAKVGMGTTANAEVTAAENPPAVAWRGTIHMGGNDVEVVLHITESADHSFTARMDIPNAGRKDVAIDEFRRVGDDIQLSIKNLVNFDGKLNKAGDSFSGVWKQAGNSFSATFHKSIGDPSTTLVRPQAPKRPYPYREEEVAVEQKRDGLKLSGTLTLPSLAAETARGPYPAVLLVTGSGPQDRDETVAGHRPFLILADFLTRRGIAVLRVDDRGIGKSTGDFNRADASDFTQDASACIEYLAARQDIDPKRIGVIGHSEGATIASILASRNSQVAFIVMLAGPGLPGDQLAYSQSAAMLRADGANEEQIASNHKLQEKVIAILKGEKNPSVAERKLREVIRAALDALPDAQQKAMGDVNQLINAEVKRLLSPDSRFGVEYDPATTLKKISCPVLAIDGEKDVVVVASENLPRIEAALTAGGNTHYKIQALPHLNHLFQNCTTGSMNEYDKIEETFSPDALEIIGTWVQQQTSERPRLAGQLIPQNNGAPGSGAPSKQNHEGIATSGKAAEQAKYRIEDVQIPLKSNQPLKGTLVIPVAAQRVPAMLVIPGYGRNDEEVVPRAGAPEEAGVQLGRYLAERGIAVLRVPFGSGPTGNDPDLSVSELADRALQCVDYLKGRSDIDPRRIGIFGHSAGGGVAMLAASRSSDLAFLVTAASPVESAESTVFAMLDGVLRANGATEADRTTARNLQQHIFDSLAKGAKPEELRPDLQKLFRTVYAHFPKNHPALAGKDPEVQIKNVADRQLKTLTSPWFRGLLGFDPAAALTKIHCPALVLFAEKDPKIDPQKSREIAKLALEKAGQKGSDVQIIPKADHSFEIQTASAASTDRQADQRFSPEFLKVLSSWLVERNGGERPGTSQADKP